MRDTCDRKKPAAAWAAIESLEFRALLSATLSAKGTLFVQGTAGNDAIVIGRDPEHAAQTRVVVNGGVTRFATAAVRRLELSGLAGADRLTLDDALAVVTPRGGATVLGGAGNDTLVGGSRPVTLDGGDGDDSVLGSSRGDLILAQAGNDTVAGGRGNDLIQGGAGDDVLRGSAGDDQVYGDADDDTLFGEAGADTLGGDGEDRLWFKGASAGPAAVPGNDSLVGGDGDDWITGGDESVSLHDQDNGRDTLTGGAGNDILDARGTVGGGNPADAITDRSRGDVVPTDDHTRTWTAAEIAKGEDAFVLHQHARLAIVINDGGVVRHVQIPAGVGDFKDPAVPNTAYRLHVHPGAAEDGVLHMHDVDRRTFTLGEFFRSWGVTLSATHLGRYAVGDGHTLTATVKHGKHKSVAIADLVNYVIRGATEPKDGDLITITYG